MKVGIFLTNQQRIGGDQRTALDDQIQMLHAARGAFQPPHLLPGIDAEGAVLLLLLLLLRVAQPDAEDQATAGYHVQRGEVFPPRRRGSGGQQQDAHSHTHVSRRPPLWMAANADGAVERAARLGDAWIINPHAALSTVRRQVALYRDARRAAGKDPGERLPLMREIFCAKDRQTAVEKAAPYIARRYSVYASWGQDRGDAGVHPPERKIGDSIANSLGELATAGRRQVSDDRRWLVSKNSMLLVLPLGPSIGRECFPMTKQPHATGCTGLTSFPCDDQGPGQR
jgi:alkanesulfonate monooxygenase SsuD/methylene tetrahydromethanopterin reductase-like flavin-dependent oxidoreductase (luciferase family)